MFKAATQSLFFTFTFYNCIVPMEFLPWEIRVAFPEKSQLQQSRAIKPNVHAGCFSVSTIHRTLTWTMGYLTCARMEMHVVAPRGVGHRKRACTESRLREKNPLPHRGIEPASAACWSSAVPTELHPHALQRVAYFQTSALEDGCPTETLDALCQ